MSSQFSLAVRLTNENYDNVGSGLISLSLLIQSTLVSFRKETLFDEDILTVYVTVPEDDATEAINRASRVMILASGDPVGIAYKDKCYVATLDTTEINSFN